MGKIIDEKDFLVLEDIVCYGSDGKPFEQYNKIAVAKDVVDKERKGYFEFTTNQANLHFENENKGLFLPSYALQCAVLVALFEDRYDPEISKVLMQYNRDPGKFGYNFHNGISDRTSFDRHIHNTIIDSDNWRIIHYPYRNSHVHRVERQIPEEIYGYLYYEEALKNTLELDYLKDLTGLRNPDVLLNLFEYLQYRETPYICPARSEIAGRKLDAKTFLYGYPLYYSNYTDGILGSKGVARGVRRL